jgi:hypothetical protein
VSRQIQREVGLAIRKDLQVIPVRIEDVEPSGTLEYYLNIEHWFNAFSKPLEERLDRLAGEVMRVIDLN